MAEIGAGLLWELLKHARSWLANLNRASEERQRQSVEALRGIITASPQQHRPMELLSLLRCLRRPLLRLEEVSWELRSGWREAP